MNCQRNERVTRGQADDRTQELEENVAATVGNEDEENKTGKHQSKREEIEKYSKKYKNLSNNFHNCCNCLLLSYWK